MITKKLMIGAQVKKMRQSNAPKNLNVEKIRSMYMQGYSTSAIARKFNCQLNAVAHHICNLVVPSVSMRRKNSKLNESQITEIRHLYIRKKYPSTTLSTMFEVSESCILNVVHGIYYRWVPGEVIETNGKIYVLPKNFAIKRSLNKKGSKKCGPNENTIRMVRHGTLIPLAKKYGVSTCTISRWIRKGKIKI